MPQRVVVPVPGRCQGPARGVEDGAQRGTAAWVTVELDPAGVRRARSNSPTSCGAPGPEQGQDQNGGGQLTS